MEGLCFPLGSSLDFKSTFIKLSSGLLPSHRVLGKGFWNNSCASWVFRWDVESSGVSSLLAVLCPGFYRAVLVRAVLAVHLADSSMNDTAFG